MKKLPLFSFINKLPYAGQISLFCLASFIVVIFSTPLELLDRKTTETAYNGPTNFFSVVVLAPLFETFLFQYMVFVLLSKMKIIGNSSFLIIIISSLLFGISHWYSFAYVVMASFIGVVLMYAYLFYSSKPSKAFWSVVLIHALHNLIVFAFKP